MTKRLIVGITGASGVIYGIRALQMLKAAGVESHLVLSLAAKATLAQETGWKVSDVLALASVNHDHRDVGATIASGSFVTGGMLIAPCSVKTLSAVANSYSSDLMSRAADVCLKEGRPVLLMLRETPLHLGHIRLMAQAAEAGAILFPPVPAFYVNPKTVDDIVNGTVGRALARLGIENEGYTKW
ncbi:MAG: UbiX family flavin prenyltransferase, partial [Chloroflexi bacterium]|nr:UbiX family flavin prenyltransferase [Chloroflexota bacterium]